MINYFFGLYNQIIFSLSGNDSMTKGLVTVWLLSVLGFVGRSFPRKIWIFTKSQLTVRLTLTKERDLKEAQLFSFVERWLIANNAFTVRNLSINVVDGEELKGFAAGQHLLYCKGRFFTIDKIIKEDKDRGTQHILHITTVGRDPKIFDKLIEQAAIRNDVRYYWGYGNNWGDNPWIRFSTIQPTAALFIDPEIKNIIEKKVLFFKNNRQWYIERNLPYKLTIVLYGPPGTGKTSLIRYIADMLNADMYNLNLNWLTSQKLELSMRCFRKGIPSVVCIEDFENAARSRVKKEPFMKDDSDEKDNNSNQLSGFLNVLQGVIPLDNVITIMTTNHIEKVDEAVIRKGRTDLLLEVGPLELPQLKEYFEHSYKTKFPDDIREIQPIKACDMSGLFEDHPHSPDEYLQVIREKYLIQKIDSKENTGVKLVSMK